MASWATKRRFMYGGGVILVLTLVVGIVFWSIVYSAPTCSDGVRNGEEKGVDCGGACQRICTSDALNPIVLWSKVFNISGDVYSLVAYVENPNINSKNRRAKYQFKVYDTDNKLITVIDNLYKRTSQDFVFTWQKAFEGNISVINVFYRSP